MGGLPLLRGAAPALPGSSRTPGPERWPCYVRTRPALSCWARGPSARATLLGHEAELVLMLWARVLPVSRPVLTVVRPMSAAHPLTQGSSRKPELPAWACALSNLRTTILHSKKQLPVSEQVKSYAVFFHRLTQTHVLVVKVSRREYGDSGSIPAECWKSLPPLGHFAWHWARQCTDTHAFYIAALSIIFFSWISSVAISRWQGFNSEHEHPTSTVWEHLESGPGPGLGHACHW